MSVCHDLRLWSKGGNKGRADTTIVYPSPPWAKLLVDTSQERVLALAAAPGPLARSTVYDWSQISHIGHDSIVIQAQVAASPISAAQPMDGLEVWTDTGDCAGAIADYRLRADGTITEYLFAKPGQEGLHGFDPEAIISAGRRRVMVAAAAVDQAQAYPEETLPPGPVADWQNTAQNLAGQVQEQAQSWVGYAQDRWQTDELNDQVKDKTRELRSQLNEQVSRVKKRLNPLQRALNNTIENLSDTGRDRHTIDVDSFEVWDDEDS